MADRRKVKEIHSSRQPAELTTEKIFNPLRAIAVLGIKGN
jgi:hypothetical protein